jgi:hypothetical protein
MAEFVFDNGYIAVGTNANTKTALIATKLTLEDGYESITVKRMQDKTSRTIPTMQKQQVVATFLQDFSAGAVDATLNPLKGTECYVEVRPDAGVVSNSNPQYAGTMVLIDYKPLDGQAGDKVDVVATFETNGTALVRTTA